MRERGSAPIDCFARVDIVMELGVDFHIDQRGIVVVMHVVDRDNGLIDLIYVQLELEPDKVRLGDL